MKSFLNLSLSLCLVIIYNLSTAQNGTIKGVIKDSKTQETIIGANVVWEKDKSKGASTDLDGKYELKLPAGKQTIVISSVGYAEQKKQIELKDGGILMLDIAMEVSSQQLGTVVYSEGKFAKPLEKVTVSMDVIKPNIIENKNTTSMDQAVQQAPGVVIVDNEPQIRGGSGYSFGAGSRVMVCVDDLPLLSGDAGRPSWGFLPVENVEQIEVIKGASSVLYGSAALNGVINIRTSYPRDVPQTKINVFTGLYDKPQTDDGYYAGRTASIQTGLNFLHSRKIGQLDLVWGGNLFYDQGYIGPELGDTTISGVSYNYGDDSLLTRNEAMYERRARTNINLRYRFKKVQGLSIGINGNIMYSHSNGTLLWLNDSSGLYRPYPGSVTETKQLTYNVDPFLTYYGSRGASHSIRTRMFHVNNANSGNRANKSDWFYGNYMYQQRFDDYGISEFTLTTGLMGSYTVAEASLYMGNEDKSGKSSATNLATYLQLDKTFWKRLTLNAGVRYEHFAINGEDQGKPVFRAGMNLKVTNKETYLRGSFGQGFRFPTIAEKYIFTSIGPIQIFPNQSLGSETSWNAEIGIKQGVKIGNFMGYIDAAYFNQEYKNNIEFIFGLWDSSATAGIGGLINPGFRSVNIGPTRTSGADISILGNGNIGKVGINMLLGYTYMKPISLDPKFYFDNDTTAKINYLSTSSDTANYILKYRFQHLVKADIEFTWKGFLVGGSLQYNSFMQNVDKLFEDFNNYKGIGNITAYRDRNNKGDYKIDMRVAYNINKNNRIALIINNLLNREFALRPLNILPPRIFILQYTLKI